MNKVKIIKKILAQSCYNCCDSIRGQNTKRNKCTACEGTGVYKETFYYILYKTKQGTICFDGETVK